MEEARLVRPPMIDLVVSSCGAVAQLGARLDGIEEVVGSNPIGSTNFLNHLRLLRRLCKRICAMVCAITAFRTCSANCFRWLRRKCVESLPFSIHAHMGVMSQHLRRDVPGDFSDDAVVGLCFAEPRD